MSGLFWNDYPYTDFHELNLSFLIKKMIELNETVKNFVSLNTIKYADPIQWNISSQYEKNTVVVDPQTGTAYLSVAPVPSGVALSNPDYWTVIFDLDIAQANNNITLRDDGNNVLSTFTSDAGDWLLWNGTLYKVTQAIGLSQAYVPGYNIERYTVELFIKDYITIIENIIGDLDDLQTTDKTSIVNAINEIFGDVTSIQNTIDNYEGSKLYTLNVLLYGVKNDGVTDCSATVQSLLDTYAPCALYFPCGKYLFNSKIEMPERCQLLGDNNNESCVPMTGINGAGGTVFLINFENDNFIVFRSGNVFKGILFYYPNIADNVTPTVKPFTFTWKTGLLDPIYGVKFQTLYFMNSWGCIECDTGHGDFIFNDIVGSPARYGIHLDWSGGTDIFTDIRMSYFYFTTVSTAYALFMQANCMGIWLGYSDAFHAKALYFGNLNVGIVFNESAVYPNGFAYGSIYGLSIDGCNFGIYSNGTHPIGVLVSDMMANTLTAALETGAQTNKSYFQFVNSSFWNNAPFILQESARLDICNCEFNITANTSAIKITDSDTQITLTGCCFGTNVTPVDNKPADSGVNKIFAVNNSSSVYPVSNTAIVGPLYNKNEWSTGAKDIGSASAVTLTGERTLLFNQSNAITITEDGDHAYPSGSELTIFNYGGTSGSITVNGVTKTIASNTCAKIHKYASVWYVAE